MARKGFYEELQTKKYLSTITPLMWKYVQEVFEGADKTEKKDLAKALLPKIIDKSLPTKLTGEEGGPILISIAREIAAKNKLYDSTQNPNGGSQ